MPSAVAPISAVQPMSTSGATSASGSATIMLGMMKPRTKLVASTSLREYHVASAIIVASLPSSLGWNDATPRFSQRCEPLMHKPMCGTKHSTSKMSDDPNHHGHDFRQKW